MSSTPLKWMDGWMVAAAAVDWEGESDDEENTKEHWITIVDYSFSSNTFDEKFSQPVYACVLPIYGINNQVYLGFLQPNNEKQRQQT